MKIILWITGILLFNIAAMAEGPTPTIDSTAELVGNVQELKKSIDSLTSLDNAYSSSSSECGNTADQSSSMVKYDPLCNFEGVTEEWKSNCDQLVNSNTVPKGALKFTLEVMAKNSTSFQTDQCFNKKGLAAKNHYSMKGTTADKVRERMQNGLSNKCSFVINDMGDKKAACRGTMYYINLCKQSGPQVTESYVNIV